MRNSCWRQKFPIAPIPAFSKMFVETEIAADRCAIFAKRKKRDKNDPEIALGHFVTGGAGFGRDLEAETDRRAFIGRGRTIATLPPSIREPGLPEIKVLCSIRSSRSGAAYRVPAKKKVSLTFWTVVGKTAKKLRRDRPSRPFGELLAASDAFLDTLPGPDAAYRAYPHPSRECTETRALSALSRSVCADCGAGDRTGLGRQSALWPMAISGDFPIFVLRIGDVADLEIVTQTLRFQEYMRARGLVADLVIVNEQAASYVQDLQQAIEWLCENSRLRGRELGPRQHIFAVRRDLMDEASYRTLLAAARIAFHTRNGTVFDQLERAEAAALAARDAAMLAALKEPRRAAGRRSRAFTPRFATGATQPRALLLERLRRLRPWRPRLCGAPERRAVDAAAVGQCRSQTRPSASIRQPKALRSPGAATAATSSLRLGRMIP